MKKFFLSLIGLMILLAGCNERKAEDNFVRVTLEVLEQDRPLDVFISSNYYFLAKYNDPLYEPYGNEHWMSVDSTRVNGFLKIKRLSNCNNDSITNEHYDFFGNCILKQESIIDTKINKTIELKVETDRERNKVTFEYDDLNRIIGINDSLSDTHYQFGYSDDDLEEIKQFRFKNGTSRIESVIRFKRV